MIYHDAALSYLHFLFAFILVGAIAAELFILRLPVDANVAKRLARVDLFYGVSALGVLIVGFARAIWAANGWDHYAAQPFFWAKIATFVLVGLISIVPTIAFIRWARAARAAAAFAVPESEVRSVRLLVMIEVHLLALVPLFAALMARGIGGA
jgi:putative membrane protein